MKLNHLRAFMAVAHHKSFTRAAAALHLSQPALTVQIRKLEESLKLRLLDRSSRSVELTSLGRELLPVFERMLGEVDDIVFQSHERSAGRRGLVRVAALPSFAASLLPVVIRESLAREPALSFVVRDAVASRVVDLVRSEDVDLGLTGGVMPDDDLEVLCRAEDRLCAVFPQDHALARKRKLGVKDIVAHPLVLTDTATSIRAVVDAAFRALGRRPQIACETTYMMTAVAMVGAGLGITILPASAQELRAASGLKYRPIDDEAFVRPIALVKKRRRTLSPPCEAFAASCVAALKDWRPDGKPIAKT
jgi:DNA-binding transcriptional LysR family regulator